MMPTMMRGPPNTSGLPQGGGPLRPQAVPANFLSPEAMQRGANAGQHEMYRGPHPGYPANILPAG
jgi:hypothetical protein